jgi:predicted PurR-regulated permease PerM
MAEDTQLHMEKWTRLLVIVSTLLVLIIFVAILIRVSQYIQHTILLFSLGVLVAYAFDPLVDGLRRRPELSRIIRRLPRRVRRDASAQDLMPRGLAIAIVYFALTAVVGLSIYGLGRPLAHQIRTLNENYHGRYPQRAAAFLAQTDEHLGRLGVHTDLHSEFEGYLTHPESMPESLQNAIKASEEASLSFARDLVVSAGESVIVVLISLYLLIYCRDMRRWLNEQAPDRLRRHLMIWEEDVNRILGGYVRGQLTIAIVTGVAAGLACLALGIHIWLLIGLFVAASSLIPVVGPYVGAIPAVIAALVGPTHLSSNIVAALILVVFFVIINEIGSKILYPKLVGHAVGLHEVLVLFVLFAGLEIDGIPGVLFAAPVTAIVVVTLIHLYRFWQDLPDSLLSARSPTLPGDGRIVEGTNTKPRGET